MQATSPQVIPMRAKFGNHCDLWGEERLTDCGKISSAGRTQKMLTETHIQVSVGCSDGADRHCWRGLLSRERADTVCPENRRTRPDSAGHADILRVLGNNPIFSVTLGAT